MRKIMVFDLGAHVGADTEYYSKKGCKVIAVEANPSLASSLKEKFRRDEVVVISKALSEDKSVNLFIPDKASADCWGTTSENQRLMLTKFDIKCTSVSVEGCDLDSLIEEFGAPYYIKCDIEGSDIDFLKMLVRTPKKPEYFSVEVPQGSLIEAYKFLLILKQSGCGGYFLVDQKKINKVVIVDGNVYRPAGMWSGQFGDDLPSHEFKKFRTFFVNYIFAILRNRMFGEFGLAGRFGVYGLFRRLETIPLIGGLFYTSWYDLHGAFES